MEPVIWPDNKRFAWTVFDDPDAQLLENGKEVYAFLRDLGLRTTKGVWPVRGPREPSDRGGTCSEPAYRDWVQQLQEEGFEIGLHNVTLHTSTRPETLAGLDRFAEYFHGNPRSMANHFAAGEGIYFGDSRLSGINRTIYNVLTRWRNHNRFHGHVEGHEEFWGDICRERIQYVRNFVFSEINTLKVCPEMPYHDPDRPYVQYWYASSEGSRLSTFNRTMSEPNQDQLEEEGGACIMYTHFGHGYHEGKVLNRRFRELMERLARKNGWFVPVSTLLDYLLSRRENAVISRRDRNQLERRWLMHKVRFGTA